MDLEIREMRSKKELKQFIDFQFQLYRGNTFWCPPLRRDEMKTLDPESNPAFEYCGARYWMAYKNNHPVGRIAGILNHKANERWNEKLVRFGWIDFIDDPEVSAALINTVESWGREKGMTGIHGPLGFTDMDNEGMLIRGFEELSILSALYNFDYYPAHMEQLGFRKAADWVQYELPIPYDIPEKVLKAAEIVKKRYGLHTLKVRKTKELLPYARKMFLMMNTAYEDLYGFVPLSEKLMNMYTEQYFGFIRPEFVSFVIDQHDDVVGFGISLPNLTRALQKCNGYLFPFGFLHLLRAIRKNDIIDMYLLGVHPEYQGKGVAALFFNEMHQAYIRYGIRKAISSPQLMDNTKALTIWKNFEYRQHIRRRCWIRHFS